VTDVTYSTTDAEGNQHAPVKLEHGRQVDLTALLASTSTQIVHIGDEVICVVEAPHHAVTRKTLADPDTRDMQMNMELGRTGTSNWGLFMREEYNSELRGRLGLVKYDRMRRSDASVRASLRTIKTPILGATWYVEPYDSTPASKAEAKLIRDCLTKYQTYTWTQTVWEALLMLDFGYYMFEKVYTFKEVDGQRRVIYKKLPPRHPLDVVDWKWDRNGGPDAVEMYDENPVIIPIEKLAVFTFDGEGGDIRGISILRSAYKHWYFKENLYKIDAIQKERHGIGIPVITLPPNYSPDDKRLANELGANLRTNEKAHIVMPPLWEIAFAKLEGQPVNALDSAKHHTEMIFQNVLAQAVYASAEGDAQSMMDLFYKSTRYIADLLRGVINKYCIPYLMLANFGHDRFPELRVRRLGDTAEARTISFALRNLVGAGIVQVDEPLEAWSREFMDAPAADPSTTREVSTPQQPGGGARVGPPRQAQAKSQRNAPSGAAGRDESGG